MKKKVLLITILIGVLSLSIIFKKEDNKLIKENTKSDNKKIAVNISEDGTNYTSTDEIPTTGYSLNTEKSMCKVATNSIANAPKDNNITIEYTDGKINFLGVTKQSTRCYLYFDKKDEEKPVITNIATSVTTTEINVTVTASDNEGVTEYWYQLNSNTPVQKTTNTHTFTGLSAGATYSIKVYVKDKAGNQSDTTTKSVTTKTQTEETLTKLNITNYKTTAPDFSKAATTDEGIYRVSDGMYGGYSYYWRGAVTNNHVKFANKYWQIIRINGDGSIRLIYNGYASGVTNSVYNTRSDNSIYVGYTYSSGKQHTTAGTSSNLKIETEKWYNNNLSEYDSFIENGKFCNDRNVASGYTWSSDDSIKYLYASYDRLDRSKSPTLSCPSKDIYTLKVGAITADEVAYAGSGVRLGTANHQFYLYRSNRYYWTMTPFQYGEASYKAYVYVIDNDGQLISLYVNNTATANISIVPVINLRSDVIISGGDGTLNNPYVVSS